MLVFSWTGGNTTAGNPTAIDGRGIGGAALGMYHAFIQFAGFTIGRTVSAFDTPWQSYPAGGPDNLPGGSNHVTGVNQITYTADFGQGVSGSVALDERSGGTSDTNLVFQPVGRFTAGWHTGHVATYGANNIGGTRMPDIIGQLRVDQAWGLFQLSAALHNNHAAYYGATEATGHPNDKLGFAIQGGLSIKNIPTGPGDTINMQAVYTDGATRYNFQSLFPHTYRDVWRHRRLAPTRASGSLALLMPRSPPAADLKPSRPGASAVATPTTGTPTGPAASMVLMLS